jgi:hypothetical protein
MPIMTWQEGMLTPVMPSVTGCSTWRHPRARVVDFLKHAFPSAGETLNRQWQKHCLLGKIYQEVGRHCRTAGTTPRMGMTRYNRIKLAQQNLVKPLSCCLFLQHVHLHQHSNRHHHPTYSLG